MNIFKKIPIYTVIGMQLIFSSVLYAIKPLILPFLDIEDEIKLMSICETPWILVKDITKIPSPIIPKVVAAGWFMIAIIIWSVLV